MKFSKFSFSICVFHSGTTKADDQRNKMKIKINIGLMDLEINRVCPFTKEVYKVWRLFIERVFLEFWADNGHINTHIHSHTHSSGAISPSQQFLRGNKKACLHWISLRRNYRFPPFALNLLTKILIEFKDLCLWFMILYINWKTVYRKK